MGITPTRRAYYEAEGEKRFCTLMALQYAETMASSGGIGAFEHARDKYREYAGRMEAAEAELIRLGQMDLDETMARPLFGQAQQAAT